MNVAELLDKFMIKTAANGLDIFSPLNGKQLCTLVEDNVTSIATKSQRSESVQKSWKSLNLTERAEFLERFIANVKANKEFLTQIIKLDSGKTTSEAQDEVTNFITIFNGMIETILRNHHERGEKVKKYLAENNKLLSRNPEPVGVCGVITSYNFPFAVASWSLAPMLMTGDAAIWKPSEKTPLAALAVKHIFDQTAGELKDLLQIVIGGRETGAALVKQPEIGMISATGSVLMGKAIKEMLAQKPTNYAPPILELGGNNGVLVSNINAPQFIERAANGIIHSFLAGGGQKCTNTRRVFIQKNVYVDFVKIFKAKITEFNDSRNYLKPEDAPTDKYGYAPLIDKTTYDNFCETIRQAKHEGGKVTGGKRIWADIYPNAYYVTPAIIEMPGQTAVMHKECFGPLIFFVKYTKFKDGANMVVAPKNAGLVNGIYTQSEEEIFEFREINNPTIAVHTVENSKIGTSTPANKMGFGGVRDSGMGIILDWDNPQTAFTKGTSRIVNDSDVPIIPQLHTARLSRKTRSKSPIRK